MSCDIMIGYKRAFLCLRDRTGDPKKADMYDVPQYKHRTLLQHMLYRLDITDRSEGRGSFGAETNEDFIANL